MTSAVLYTPEMLALATSLAQFPLSDDMPLRGTARSRSCGSTLNLGLSLDPEGRIARVGLLAQACAVGQASAALFARGAQGLDHAALSRSVNDIAAWLDAGGDVPDWPGLDAIAMARDYPARHGAIMLAWNAALAALSTRPATG